MLSLLGKFVRRYFENTSVHGFKYLVEARDNYERLAWIAAVPAAFAFAVYFVASGVRDNSESPFVTSVDSVDISTLPFPSVSFFPTTTGGNRESEGPGFAATVLNNALYDCSEFKVTAC